MFGVFIVCHQCPEMGLQLSWSVCAGVSAKDAGDVRFERSTWLDNLCSVQHTKPVLLLFKKYFRCVRVCGICTHRGGGQWQVSCSITLSFILSVPRCTWGCTGSQQAPAVFLSPPQRRLQYCRHTWDVLAFHWVMGLELLPHVWWFE